MIMILDGEEGWRQPAAIGHLLTGALPKSYSLEDLNPRIRLTTAESFEH